jgi:hypothetical protein
MIKAFLMDVTCIYYDSFMKNLKQQFGHDKYAKVSPFQISSERAANRCHIFPTNVNF